MPSPSKRIQVVLRKPMMDILDDFALESGLTWSKSCALLIEEALTARGWTGPKRNQNGPSNIVEDVLSTLPAEKQEQIEVVSTPNLKTAVTSLNTEEKKEALENTANADAQMLKLKVMQELMEQLKSI